MSFRFRRRSEFAFEDVSFSYDARSTVLSAVSFHAKVGEITAIAGPSGSGKSTLIALMLRFFDPRPKAASPSMAMTFAISSSTIIGE